MGGDAHIYVWKPGFQGRLQPGRIGLAFRPPEGRGTGSYDDDIELLLLLRRLCDVTELAFTKQKIPRHIADVGPLRRGAARKQMKNEERNSQRLHASPPAMSASVVFVREPGFRPSISLYHDNKPPVAIINPTPTILTTTCMATLPEISLI